MRLNFQPSEYTDTRGKVQPMYYITKDGFMLLVFGFNGRDANKLKIMFINAFNVGQEALAVLDNDNAVLQTRNGHPITIIADELGMSAIKLNKILVQWGVQRKVVKTYVTNEAYRNRGYTSSSYTHKYINPNNDRKYYN